MEVAGQADSVGTLGLSYHRSQSLNGPFGQQVIDPVSKLPIDAHQINVSYGANAIPNGIDGGITAGQAISTFIVPTLNLYEFFSAQ